MMADESDDCRDVVRYWQTLNEGYDCVFSSRFMRGGGVIDYPRFKTNNQSVGEYRAYPFSDLLERYDKTPSKPTAAA
jgi:hypothetical protein